MPTPEEITRHHDSAPPEGRSPWVGEYRPRTDIAVVDPDPRWPAAYVGLREQILAALGERALVIEHVGSTSVPGLAAKPVIDVDLTVADPADEAAYVADLEALGFRLVVREPWWHEHRAFSWGPLTPGEPRANLHVFGPDSPETVRHRIFRDWLRTHPEERALYEATKLGAASAANAAGEHTMDYNARKEPVIREIYDRAFRAAGLL